MKQYFQYTYTERPVTLACPTRIYKIILVLRKKSRRILKILLMNLMRISKKMMTLCQLGLIEALDRTMIWRQHRAFEVWTLWDEDTRLIIALRRRILLARRIRLRKVPGRCKHLCYAFSQPVQWTHHHIPIHLHAMITQALAQLTLMENSRYISNLWYRFK